MEKVFTIDKSLDYDLAKNALHYLMEQSNKKMPGVLYFNCNGGSCAPAVFLAHTIKSLSVPVIGIAGAAQSAALEVFSSCHVRIMASKGFLGYHSSLINLKTIEGSAGVEWFKNNMAALERDNKYIAEAMETRSLKPKEFWLELSNKYINDCYIIHEKEALDMGLIEGAFATKEDALAKVNQHIFGKNLTQEIETLKKDLKGEKYE